MHFPVAIFACVERVSLERAVLPLLDMQANPRACSRHGAQLLFGVERAVAKTGGPDQPHQSRQEGRSDSACPGCGG